MMLLTNIAEDMSLSLNNDAHIETVARLERCVYQKKTRPWGLPTGEFFVIIQRSTGKTGGKPIDNMEKNWYNDLLYIGKVAA